MFGFPPMPSETCTDEVGNPFTPSRGEDSLSRSSPPSWQSSSWRETVVRAVGSRQGSWGRTRP